MTTFIPNGITKNKTYKMHQLEKKERMRRAAGMPSVSSVTFSGSSADCKHDHFSLFRPS